MYYQTRYFDQEIIDRISKIKIGKKFLNQTVHMNRVLNLMNHIHDFCCRFDTEDVPVSRKTLEKKIFKNPNKTVEIFNQLLEQEIIICSNYSYQEGSHSRCYKLGEWAKDVSWCKKSPTKVKTKVEIYKPDYDGRLDFLSIDKDAAISMLHKLDIPQKKKDIIELDIKNFDPSFIICSTGRQFGVWNRIPKELRQFIKINGEEVVEPDVSSSHVSILAGISEDPNLIESVNNFDFYEKFAAAHNYDRANAKHRIMLWLGGCGHMKDVDSFMLQNYPVAYGFRTGYESYERGSLSRMLQSIEASLILPICEDYNGASVHDSIICAKSKAEDVIKSMKESYSDLGVTVRVKVKNS